MRQEQKTVMAMKIIVLPRVQQEAPMVTPLIRWAEPQAATIRSLRKPKTWRLLPEGNGKCQPGIVLWTVRRNRFLCSTAGNRDVYDQHRYRSGR